MEITFNKKAILKNIGIECVDDKDCIRFIKSLVDDLERNNKNYTKKQYFEIIEIKEILENIKDL